MDWLPTHIWQMACCTWYSFESVHAPSISGSCSAWLGVVQILSTFHSLSITRYGSCASVDSQWVLFNENQVPVLQWPTIPSIFGCCRPLSSHLRRVGTKKVCGVWTGSYSQLASSQVKFFAALSSSSHEARKHHENVDHSLFVYQAILVFHDNSLCAYDATQEQSRALTL